MKAGKRTRSLAVGVVAALAAAALLLYALSTPPAPPAADPLPNPNGYDDLIAGGQMLHDFANDWTALSDEELSAAIAANSNAFARIQLGLSRESRVPIQYNTAYLGKNLSALAMFKGTAIAIEEKGKMAEQGGRPYEAARNYVDTITLGAESQRGGFLIHSLVQIAIEQIGAKRLAGVVTNLTAAQAHDCLASLLKAEGDREPFQKFAERERVFSHRAGSFQERMGVRFLQIIGRDPISKTIERTRVKYNASQLKIYALVTELARRAFELEKNRPAKNWEDLVPAYLPAIPRDPTNNLPVPFSAL